MKPQPALIGAAIAAILNIATVLVLHEELSLEAQAGIISATDILAGVFIRSQVTPVKA